MIPMNMSNPASLPPGFRFHPTDEELILHYLKNRAAATPCPASIIAEVDIYKFDPWDLPDKAIFGDREWYFFTPRDRKYPNGIRPNRAAASGYWKATGTDKPIHASKGNENIGVKKALVFYKGRPPKGLKTNWIMHEYRIAETRSSNSYRPMKFKDTSMRLDDWVLCRIYKKSSHVSQAQSQIDNEQDESCSEELYTSNNYQNNTQMNNNLRLPKTSSLSEFLDYATISNLFDNIPEASGMEQNQFFVTGGTNNSDGNGGNLAEQVMKGGSPVSVMGESSLKRQRDGGDCFFEEGNGYLINPSKRVNDSCIVPNFSNQIDGLQSFYTQQQQMLLGSHFGKN